VDDRNAPKADENMGADLGAGSAKTSEGLRFLLIGGTANA